MVNEEVLKELGAEWRTWPDTRSGLRGALEFFVDQRARDMDTSPSYEIGGSPMSLESINMTRATYAKITFCLRDQDPWRLLEWHRTWDDPGTLARKWGFAGQTEMTEAMLGAEDLVRERMRMAGLLVKDPIPHYNRGREVLDLKLPPGWNRVGIGDTD
jgi:hypothetical protein